ncbi:MAG: NapC/NirT family cytochrome c, partial [Thiotrichaceae bacterium]|nr:NapC/NirT family cytochrome c [Thiotrichaceae bacterium]
MFGKLNSTVITIFGAGTLLGILFWGGLHMVIEQTNSMEFCISCHE